MPAELPDGFPRPEREPPADGDGVYAGAHAFLPLWLLDRLRASGRCAHCYLPKMAHPVLGWTQARFYGDRSKAGLGHDVHQRFP